MADEKRSKNPFINMANATKKNNVINPQQQPKLPKSNKGFGGNNIVRRTGRGR